MKRIKLSDVEYQERFEQPRGAFAAIWEPDKKVQTVSAHKVKVENRAVANADRNCPATKQVKKEAFAGLLLRDLS
jgi:hypothetical protein